MHSDAIDLDHLSVQTAGDTVLQRELLALFVAQSTLMRARLFDRDDHAPDLLAALHTLKGSARALGATAVAAAADAAERELATGPGAAESQGSAALRTLESALAEAREFAARLLREV